jgi:nucleoside-diphosphate-sugar epimerase
VLLTGASGFLGTHVATSLVSAAHEVVVASRHPSSGADGREWLQLDLARPLAGQDLPAAVDAVVHLAQSARYRDFPAGARDVFEVNVRSTFELLEYAREAGASTFVLTSTGGLYDSSPAMESDPIRPRTAEDALAHYVNTKHAAEVLAASYTGILTPIVLRPFFIYGPGQREMLVSNLARRVLDGGPVVIDGAPGLTSNPVFVEDAARAVTACLDQTEPGTFNVAGAESVTLEELARLIADAADADVEVTARPGASRSLVADITRMRETLGVEPEIPLEEGTRRLVAWLRGTPG